jgi:hypothetical protein
MRLCDNAAALWPGCLRWATEKERPGPAAAGKNKKICQDEERQKHTTGGIPRWSPTLVLVARFSAYVWQSGRDAQFSLTYGRMYYDRADIEYSLSQNGAPRRKQAVPQLQKCKETKGQTPDDQQLSTRIPASPFPDAQVASQLVPARVPTRQILGPRKLLEVNLVTSLRTSDVVGIFGKWIQWIVESISNPCQKDLQFRISTRNLASLEDSLRVPPHHECCPISSFSF